MNVNDLNDYIGAKDYESVKKLLNSGINSNEKDSNEDFPIWMAILSGDIKILNILVEHGANINILINKGANETPILKYFLSGMDVKIDILKEMIKHGANINESNIDGYTPLILASMGNDFESVKVLLENGANIDDENYLDENAIDISITSKMRNYLTLEKKIRDALGYSYNYKGDRKNILLKSIKINPSIYDNLLEEDRNLIKNEPSIQHLTKSDEYGLFERRVLNYKNYINKK